MSAIPKQIVDPSVEREEALRLAARLESSHLAFALPGWLMRYLSAIVRILTRVVHGCRQNSTLRGPIAPKLVGDQSTRLFSLPFQHLAEEALGCSPIAARLNQNIDDISILVNGAPEILTFVVDPHEQLINVPGVAQTTFASFQRSLIAGSELQAPSPN